MLSGTAPAVFRPDLPTNLTKFKNCRILRDHKIIKEDLWVRGGTIIDPEKVFFDEKVHAHLVRKQSFIIKLTRRLNFTFFYQRLHSKLIVTMP